MSLLAPKLSILDETDSGLDIDALKIVADGVNTLRDKKNSFLIITPVSYTHLTLPTTTSV